MSAKTTGDAMTPNQITEMLAAHKKWCCGKEGGKRAYLRGAYLRGADLSGANLRDARMIKDAVIAQDITFGDLIAVLPELFTAGGKTIEQVVTREVLTCHSWENCPMAAAYAAHSVGDVPLPWRPWASLFILAFDANLLTPETIAEACGVELGDPS